MKRSLIGVSLLCIGAATFMSACSSKKSVGVSQTTGWDYNDPRLGGFDVANYPGQQTVPASLSLKVAVSQWDKQKKT
jgi:sulfatase modifying factor 1